MRRPDYRGAFSTLQQEALQRASDFPIPVLCPETNWLKTLAKYWSRGYTTFRLTPGTYAYDGSWDLGPDLCFVGTSREDVIIEKRSGALSLTKKCRMERLTIRLATDVATKTASMVTSGSNNEFHDCILDLNGTDCKIEAENSDFVGCLFKNYTDLAVYQTGDWLRLLHCKWDISGSIACARLLANSQAVGSDCHWTGVILYHGASAGSIARSGNMAVETSF